MATLVEQHAAFNEGWSFGYKATIDRWTNLRHQDDYDRTCDTVRTLAEQRVERSNDALKVAYAMGLLEGCCAAYEEVGDPHAMASIGRFKTPTVPGGVIQTTGTTNVVGPQQDSIV